MSPRKGSHLGQSNRMDQKIHTYYLPLARQIDKLLLIIFSFLFLSLCLAQFFLLTKPAHQELVSKTVRYEGVFREDQIEHRATLQHR